MRKVARWFVVLGVSGVSVWAGACSSSSNGGGGAGGGGGGGGSAGDGAAAQGFTISSACTDSIDSVYADPGPITGAKGTILKCARDANADMNPTQLQALAVSDGYQGRTLTSGAQVYRISYVTERGSQPPTPGFDTAIVLLPDTPAAAQVPAVVSSHGIDGQAAKCIQTPTALSTTNNSFALQFLPLAGAGFAVVAHDYSGFGGNWGTAGNPPPGALFSDDEGKGALDALRALRTLVTTGLSDKNVIVGHSQGGHSALSALALSPTYAPELNIVGTATYSPLWFNEASWGALLFLAGAFPIAQNNFPVAVGIWYLYSHGEILDGPGHGLDPFVASKQAAVKNFFDNTCGSDDLSVLNQLGTYVTDFYDPTFTKAIESMAATGSACPTDPTLGPICQKWQARYAADRPPLTGTAASAPILYVYGLDDTTIPPDRATCGMDKLKSEAQNLTFCIVPGEDHGGILKVKADYVNDWIASVALGAAAPTPCTLHSESDVATDAGPVTCATPPPN